jgi:hypothetical protein
MKEINRKRGRVFTTGNPFEYEAFTSWVNQFDYKNVSWLEPFAGSNNLIHLLKNSGYCKHSSSYDVNPKHNDIKRRDTIQYFPKGFEVCVTNPPWLAKNSAKRRGLNIKYPSGYEDLYQVCIEKALENVDFLCMILPESFITSGLFHDRLQSVVSINKKIFDETDFPCCLALWGPNTTDDFEVWVGNEQIGLYNDLLRHIPQSKKQTDIRFNDPFGDVGLLAIDNTRHQSIRFCDGSDIEPNKIKVSSRSCTRVSIPCLKKEDFSKIITLANKILNDYRTNTRDIYLTSFRGLRKDGYYRRRLDWATARNILTIAVTQIYPS